MHISVALLGFGSFGRFAAMHLAAHAEVRVHDVVDRSAEVAALNAELSTRQVAPIAWCSLAEACRAEVLVFAVPVQAMEGLLTQVSPRLRERATPPLVLDVASVKLRPIALLTGALPPGTPIIGTHPCFGPQSAKHGLADQPIALCNATATAETYGCVRQFLSQTLGLRVIETTPDEHDRQMAYVQGLTHLITRAVGEMALPETPLATAAYQRFLAMRDNLKFDSWDLFITIARENPYAAAVRLAFQNKIEEIERRLDEDASR